MLIKACSQPSTIFPSNQDSFYSNLSPEVDLRSVSSCLGDDNDDDDDDVASEKVHLSYISHFSEFLYR